MNTLAVMRRQIGVELRLTARRWGEALNPLVFFASVVALFPLGLSPDPKLLAGYAAGVVWVAALLAALFAQARQFRAEAYNGCLEQMILSPYPLALQMAAKMLAQWLLLAAPLVLLAPLCGYALHLPASAMSVLVLALLLATPVMVVLGAVGAALTVHANQGGALLSVLVLPMLVPVLVFGARATELAANDYAPDAALYWLAALCAAAVFLGPFAIAAAVRVSID